VHDQTVNHFIWNTVNVDEEGGWFGISFRGRVGIINGSVGSK